MFLILTFMVAQPVNATAAEIRVWTARALATVLKEIGPEFERTTGHKIVITSDLSTGFTRRANAGEQFDLVISASAPVDEWIKAGKIISETRTANRIRFANRHLQPGEMNHSGCVRLVQCVLHRGTVGDVTQDETHGCELIRFHDRAEATRIVAAVENNRAVASLDE